jgi:hypothetical protein
LELIEKGSLVEPGWTALEPEVAAFLDEFDRRAREGSSGPEFADAFLSLDSATAAVVTRESLVAALPRRRHLFDSAGLGDPRPVSARQLVLDARHVLLRVAWRVDRRRGVGGPVRLESSFLLRREGSALQIHVYVNHIEDLAAALAAGGGPVTDTGS